eukprot:7376258-Prymnesium_polylepis.2
MQKPVENFALRGVGVRDAAFTYLDEWGVPSGGDWALHRGGAVFVEGATNFSAQGCTFEHLQTNAVFLSGFTRNATIVDSRFEYLGESAVALWGYTRDVVGAPPGRLPEGVGIDGDGGEQPRGTTFAGNLVANIGLTERQSSAFGEFKACGSLVERNIVFNIPRAAINSAMPPALPLSHLHDSLAHGVRPATIRAVNDGFGGGTIIQNNLLFNTCRESGDHGPFNSWDRIPFIVNGTVTPRYNVIAHNLIFSNYGAGFGVDNDGERQKASDHWHLLSPQRARLTRACLSYACSPDTSSYYHITSNVFYGGGGVKCDYDGHDKYFEQNVMVAQQGGAACHHTCAYRKPFTDHCVNNTIVQATVNGKDLGQVTDPFAIVWFCDAKDPSSVSPSRGYFNRRPRRLGDCPAVAC